MSEDKELKEQAQAIRDEVQTAFESFMRVYDAAESAFNPIAHELRVSGHRVKGMSPNWMRRAVHYGKYAERCRFPVK